MIRKPRRYTHSYYEEYARLSLSIIFPDWSERFVVADKPDLQSDDGTVGIEVTSAERERIRQNDSYAAQFFEKKVTQEEIGAFRGQFWINSEGRVYASSPTKGLITPLKYADIESIINNKVQKAENYKHFDSLGLYIFSPVSFVDEDLRQLSKIQNGCFDFYIINCQDQIHVLKEENVRTFDVPCEDMRMLKECALHYERNA